MKFTELKEKTELKNYVKNLTDTITDNDIDICHDEQNDSPADNELKTTLILLSDKKNYTEYEKENFPEARTEINNILKLLKKDNEIKLINIETVLEDEQTTQILNWITDKEHKRMTQIKGEFHGYTIFNLFIYGTGIYKTADIKNAVKKCKHIFKIINDTDINTTVPYFFIE